LKEYDWSVGDMLEFGEMKCLDYVIGFDESIVVVFELLLSSDV
jgi:hypothetical protein